MLAWVGRFLMKDIQAFMSLAMHLLTFFQTTSDYLIPYFLWSSSEEATTNISVLHLLNHTLSSILSICSNHCSLLSCKRSLMLFSFSLVFSSTLKILSSGLTLHIHLTIPAPFLASLVPSSS